MYKITNIISKNEKLIAVRHPHWIYLVQGVVWFVLIAGIGIMADALLYRYAGSIIPPGTSWFYFDWGIFKVNQYQTPISLFGIITGTVVMLPHLLTYIATVIALTDKRFIYKKGLIFVIIDQIDLEDIRAEYVDHGYLGWLLGYASIRFDCRFIKDVRLPAIANPYSLVKATHNVRYKHPHIIEYGQDEFERDLERIDEEGQRYSRSGQFMKLKEKMATNFRKAAQKIVKK